MPLILQLAIGVIVAIVVNNINKRPRYRGQKLQSVLITVAYLFYLIGVNQ